MAFTTEKLSILEDAIAQGALRVKYQDKEVTYHSLDQMIKLRDLMRRELGVVKKGPYRRLASTSKGL